jgi:hypothetical protein
MLAENQTARVVKSMNWSDGSRTVTVEVSSFDGFLNTTHIATQTHSSDDPHRLNLLLRNQYGLWITE